MQASDEAAEPGEAPDSFPDAADEAATSSASGTIGVAVFGFSPAAAYAIDRLLQRQLLRQPNARELRLVGCWTSDAAERAALEAFLAGCGDLPDGLLVGDDPAVLAARPEVSVMLLACRCHRVQTALARMAAETGSLAVRLSTPPQPPHAVPDSVAVGCSYRYLGPVRRMKACLAEGKIGRLQAVRVALRCRRLVGPRYDWSCDPSMGGGVLAYYGALVVDLVHFVLMPAEVLRASGQLRTCGGSTQMDAAIRRVAVDQLAAFDLQLAGDCWVHVWLDSLAGGYSHTVELIGEQGRLTLEDFTLSHATDGCGEAEILHRDPLTEADLQLMERVYSLTPDMPGRQFASPALVKCVSALVDAIAREEAIIDYPSDGYWCRVQRTLLAVRLSSQLRRWVSLTECPVDASSGAKLPSA